MPPAPPIKPVIGIIGGIGSGKTTVADELSSLGCAVIDADAIGHELLVDPEVRGELRNRFESHSCCSNKHPMFLE